MSLYTLSEKYKAKAYTQANGYIQNTIDTQAKQFLANFIENYQCVSVLEAKPKLKRNQKISVHIYKAKPD